MSDSAGPGDNRAFVGYGLSPELLDLIERAVALEYKLCYAHDPGSRWDDTSRGIGITPVQDPQQTPFDPERDRCLAVVANFWTDARGNTTAKVVDSWGERLGAELTQLLADE